MFSCGESPEMRKIILQYPARNLINNINILNIINKLANWQSTCIYNACTGKL